MFVLTRLLRLRCARWLAVGHGLGQLVKSRRQGPARSLCLLSHRTTSLAASSPRRHTTQRSTSTLALSVTISFSTLSSQFSPKNKVPTQWLHLSLSLSLSPPALSGIYSITNGRAMGQSTENNVLRTWQMRRDVTRCGGSATYMTHRGPAGEAR